MIKKTIVLLWVLFSISSNSYGQDVESYLNKMMSAISNTKTLKYDFKQYERLRKGVNKTEVKIKLNVKPQKVYIKCVHPDEGVELLLEEGKYGGNAYVNPNGFPYINVKLDPLGSRLLGTSSHHPLGYTGYDFFYEIIESYKNDPKVNVNDLAKIVGETIYDNRTCIIVEIIDPNYSVTNYTVKAGENILDFARRDRIADYKILELNPSVDDYFDVSAGQALKVPTSYSKKTVLYLDTERFLPLKLEMTDEVGIYERYEFLNLEVNPDFTSDEFSNEFPAYGF